MRYSKFCVKVSSPDPVDPSNPLKSNEEFYQSLSSCAKQFKISINSLYKLLEGKTIRKEIPIGLKFSKCEFGSDTILDPRIHEKKQIKDKQIKEKQTCPECNKTILVSNIEKHNKSKSHLKKLINKSQESSV